MDPFQADAGPSRLPDPMTPQWAVYRDSPDPPDSDDERSEIDVTPPPQPPPRSLRKRKRVPARPPPARSFASVMYGDPFIDDPTAVWKSSVSQSRRGPKPRPSTSNSAEEDSDEPLPEVEDVITASIKKNAPTSKIARPQQSIMSKDSLPRLKLPSARPSLPSILRRRSSIIAPDCTRRRTYATPRPAPMDVIDLTNDPSDEGVRPPKKKKALPRPLEDNVDVIEILDSDEEAEVEARKRAEKSAGKGCITTAPSQPSVPMTPVPRTVDTPPLNPLISSVPLQVSDDDMAMVDEEKNASPPPPASSAAVLALSIPPSSVLEPGPVYSTPPRSPPKNTPISEQKRASPERESSFEIEFIERRPGPVRRVGLTVEDSVLPRPKRKVAVRRSQDKVTTRLPAAVIPSTSTSSGQIAAARSPRPSPVQPSLSNSRQASMLMREGLEQIQEAPSELEPPPQPMDAPSFFVNGSHIALPELGEKAFDDPGASSSAGPITPVPKRVQKFASPPHRISFDEVEEEVPLAMSATTLNALPSPSLGHSSLGSPDPSVLSDVPITGSSWSPDPEAFSEDAPFADSGESPDLGYSPASSVALDIRDSPELGASPAESLERAASTLSLSPTKRSPGNMLRKLNSHRAFNLTRDLSSSPEQAGVNDVEMRNEDESSGADRPHSDRSSPLSNLPDDPMCEAVSGALSVKPSMSLQNAVLVLSDKERKAPNLRLAFEAHIVSATSEDEPHAPKILVSNVVDDEPCPKYEFCYTNLIIYGEDVPRPDHGALKGCDCEGPCNPALDTCACARRQAQYGDQKQGFAHTKEARLRSPKDTAVIMECNSACSCSESCMNRVIQRGRKVHIEIKKTVDKGWGVFATRYIPPGSYVGIYSGELLTDKEAEIRGIYYDALGRTYLFNLDFGHLKKLKQDARAIANNTEVPVDSTDGTEEDDRNPYDENLYAVDAFHYGNFTRFLNHSCDPNCAIHAAYIDEADIQKPMLVLYTKRAVNKGDELCFSYYGEKDDDDVIVGQNQQTEDRAYTDCHCGAPRCRNYYFR